MRTFVMTVMAVALVAGLGGCNKDDAKAGESGAKANAKHGGQHSSKSPEDFPPPAELCKDAVAAIAAAELPDGVSSEAMDKMKGMRDRCIAALSAAEGQLFSDQAECILAAKSFTAFDSCYMS